MTEYGRPATAEEFLRTWHALAAANDTSGLEQWERHFPDLAAGSPDVTLDILQQLAESDTRGATEAAALYARYLFDKRPTETTDLLVGLFQVGSIAIQENVLSTVDVITRDKKLNPDTVRLTAITRTAT